MKSYTDLEQSKKLAEFLLVESSDMYWDLISKDKYARVNNIGHCLGRYCIYAWSLSALLELIPPYLGNFNDGIDFGLSKAINGKWYSAYYIKLDDNGLASFNMTVTGDTAIDAAFEMIVWLKENNKI